MLCLASPSCTSPSALCRQTRLLFGGSADGRGEICRRRVLSTGSTGLGQCARRRSRIQVASCSRHALCVVASATSERVHVDASPFEGLYEREVKVAIQAVRLACGLCQKVQAGIMVQEELGLDTKQDRSLVTTADYACQALISKVLSDAFGDSVSLVAEEDSASLRQSEQMLARVTDAVNDALANTTGHSLLSQDQVLRCIDRGCSPGGRTGRHWVLDPVDGTLGFVRGDQYAVALALVDDGNVVVAALGCPNMPTASSAVMESSEQDGTLFYGFHTRVVSKMLAGAKGAGAWYKGVLFAAAKGSGTWVQPVDLDVPAMPTAVHVSTEATPGRMRITEPVLKANSSQSLTASIAATAGLAPKPLRLYSMVKYGAVARGDADVFMKFPKPGYKEKIWDHAAGVLVVAEAGGVVTDAGGQALDFGSGRFLEGLDRGIVAGTISAHSRVMSAIQASWASSQL